ncbi:hypothetical protein D3C71_1913700 [compost metagenome]
MLKVSFFGRAITSVMTSLKLFRELITVRNSGYRNKRDRRTRTTSRMILPALLLFVFIMPQPLFS